jgi:ATP-dependent Clp protease adaptor protein ClpS
MIQRPAAPQSAEKEAAEPALEPLYHLVLLDDNDHSYEYVVELLGRVFGYARGKAFALACVVDSQGRAIVETADKTKVTRDQARIHAFGADPRIPRCAGSMSAIIEPAA